ncbi:MAG: adenylosuccinate synthase [Spirochaetales bacterium]|nr:MAG: adenylosuccinate synthase [Spirochaetales bacterium]
MNLVIVGAQWGDEGKGKIVDYLARDADTVIRYSGGANAGHTIVVDDATYKLHLVPSGIIYPGTTVVLGSSMVIDPQSLMEELSRLEAAGISWKGRVFISDRAHLVLPGYKERDREKDSARKTPLGTTGRGIGITYALKAFREGVRFADVFDSEMFIDLDEKDKAFIDSYRSSLKSMVFDVTAFMSGQKNKRVLFEGAQGVLLDLDCGTYPYVSSGCSSSFGAAAGTGIGPRDLDGVIGVFKAYTTRVGNGPFPSEFREDRDGNLGHTIREIGHEYGTTTGRPRRCGYLDLVSLRYACRTASIDSLALTHLDVYDTFDEIKACVGYRYKGREIADFPTSNEVLSSAEPVLKSFPGWKQDISSCGTYDSLPERARTYVSFIESFTAVPADIISVGSNRSQTILRKSFWS